MIRVTIDIVPFGIEHEKRTISILEIFNAGRSKTMLDGKGKDWYKYGYTCNMEESKISYQGFLNHDRNSSILILLYKIFEKIKNEL